MCDSRFKVVAAEGIKNVVSFGNQNPYVRATLLPSGKMQSKCQADESGGTSPKWNTSVRLKHDPGATSMLFEIMNENIMMDEVIGQATLSFTDPVCGFGGKCRLDLDTGGSLHIELPARFCGTSPSTSSNGATSNGAASHSRTTTSANVPALPAEYEHYRWAVIAHQAETLKDLSTFTPMDPYMMVFLTPGDPDSNSACSASQEGGGVRPKWDDGINETLDNRLMLPPHKGPSSLRIEIWSENTTVDEKIGTATLRFQDLEKDIEKYSGAGSRAWHDVDTGGRVEVTIMFSEPLAEHNVSLGARCCRGVHWICGSHDGGVGGQGTVVGFKKSDGEKEGLYPAGQGVLHAVVKWDNNRRGCYPIGALVDENDEEPQYALLLVKQSKQEQAEEAAVVQAEMDRLIAEKRAAADEENLELQKATEEAKRRQIELEREKLRAQEERHEQERIAAENDAAEAADRVAREKQEAERRFHARRSEAATVVQCRCRQIIAKQRVEVRRQQRLRQQQAKARKLLANRLCGYSARRSFLLKRKSIVKIQSVVRMALTKKKAKRYKMLATTMQRAFRGHRMLKLVDRVTSGALVVEVHRGSGLQDTSVMFAQKPYIKVTLLPAGVTHHTRPVVNGGTEPVWTKNDHNQLVLGLAGYGTKSVLIEVYSEGTFSTDELVGKVEVEVPFGTISQAQPQWLVLDPCGQLQCTLYLIPSRIYAAMVARRISTMSGAAMSHGKSRKAVKNGIGFIIVTLHAAKSLKDIGFFFAQDPYVTISVKNSETGPISEAQGRTQCAPSGAKNPTWDKSMHNTLAVEPDKSSVQLLLQVWNENVYSSKPDELIGQATISLTDHRLEFGKRRSCPLDSGGTIELTLQCTQGYHVIEAMPVTPTFTRKFVVLECHRAEDLKDVALMGEMDPFVMTRSLDVHGQAAVLRTCCAPNGGCNPRWNDSLNNRLPLELEASASTILLEIKHQSLTGDDSVGKVSIHLNTLEYGNREWYQIETGGQLAVTVWRDKYL